MSRVWCVAASRSKGWGGAAWREVAESAARIRCGGVGGGVVGCPKRPRGAGVGAIHRSVRFLSPSQSTSGQPGYVHQTLLQTHGRLFVEARRRAPLFSRARSQRCSHGTGGIQHSHRYNIKRPRLLQSTRQQRREMAGATAGGECEEARYITRKCARVRYRYCRCCVLFIEYGTPSRGSIYAEESPCYEQRRQ